MKNILLTFLLALLCLNNAAGEIYRWVDKDGKVHYGDKDSKAETSQDITEKINNHNVLTYEPGKVPVNASVHGRNVSESFVRTEHDFPLPFVVYSMREPLLPKARLLGIVERRNTLWFASDIGMLSFNRNNEQWYLYDKRSNLPGDTVYNLTADGDRLFLRVYDWGTRKNLINTRHYWFDVDQHEFTKSNKTYNQVRTGGSYTTKNSDVIANSMFNVLHYRDRVWITSATNKPGIDNWVGGVAALKPLSKRGRKYTTSDGLAHPYCYDITSSENNSVWVTHWHEERGLSFLDDHSKRWKQIKTSRNGVELGGLHIAAVGQYILVGQQGSLIIYDKKSELAVPVDTAYGMPGNIVSDIIVDDEFIWVTAYGYGGEGSDQGGLVKIAQKNLDDLFLRMQKEEKQNSVELSLTDVGLPSEPKAQLFSSLKKENRIISHDVVHDEKDRLVIDVTYYYSGNKGDNAWLGGITFVNGGSTGFWNYKPFRMERGENTGRITIGINKKVAPEYHCTDSVLFKMYTKDSSPFFTNNIRYDKCWEARDSAAVEGLKREVSASGQVSLTYEILDDTISSTITPVTENIEYRNIGVIKNEKPVSPNILDKRITNHDDLRSLTGDFDDALLGNWLSERWDCTNAFQRVDFKYNKFLQFFSRNASLVIPIVSRSDKSLELYYSSNIQYEFDTEQQVLLSYRNNGKPKILYICTEKDVPQYYIDQYNTYLINQNFLTGHGMGENIDIKDGAKFLEQECRLNYEDKEYKKARDTCEIAASNSKNVAARYYLGMLYRYNSGGEMNYKTSLKYTLEAANAGFSPAYSWAAWHYDFGKGVKKDYKKAMYWRIASVDAGHTEGAKSIARYYMRGLGVETDYMQAAVWLLIASRGGDPHAQNKLGSMYANGVGLKQNDEQAHYWIQKSEQQNNPKAVFNLAVMYEKDRIIDNGKSYAAPLYERAKELGIKESTDIMDKYDRVW